MLKEVLGLINSHQCRKIIDATFGGGGYTQAFLDLNQDTKVRAFDRDFQAYNRAINLKALFKNSRFEAFHSGFAEMAQYFPDGEKFDGIVFDLGVSSDQLESPERGFSFMRDGPLDMRMDLKSSCTSAADIINWFSVDQLAKIIFDYGEDPFAFRIATAITKERRKGPILSTLQLARIIEQAVFINSSKHSSFTHPATKTFQALRICVNEELDQLKKGLLAAFDLVKKDGIIIVVAFHSLEDMIVKNFFRDIEKKGQLTDIVGGALQPNEEEVAFNRRSRSAKLRAVKKLN